LSYLTGLLLKLPGEGFNQEIKGERLHFYCGLSKAERHNCFSFSYVWIGLMKSSVLVVDDDPINVKILKLWLEQRGLEVVTAKDGNEAIEQFLINEPTITFMDINMPNKDGKIATEVIKVTHPEAMVIALSCEPMCRYLQKDGSFTPFDDFFEKPYSFNLIKELLEKVGIELSDEV